MADRLLPETISFIKPFSHLPQGVNFTYNLNTAIDSGDFVIRSYLLER